MDKVTEVNIEGKDYGFVAGQTVKGVSGALASDYVKHVILPEGAEVVEGMLVAVTFVNENTAGYSGEKTVYSTDGINFYWDSEYTQLITLPPQGCYTVTVTETQYEYKLSEYPVLVMGDMTKPFCDSRGHPAGGKLWGAGDAVTVINLENRFIALQTTVNEIIQGSSLPVSSGAVYEKCNSLEPVDHVTSGNMHSVTSNAVAGALSGGTSHDIKVEGDDGGEYISSRDRATAKNTGSEGSWGSVYYPVISSKTKVGEWSIGSLSGDEGLFFSYTKDSDYTNHDNKNFDFHIDPYGNLIDQCYMRNYSLKKKKLETVYHHTPGVSQERVYFGITKKIMPTDWHAIAYMPNQSFAFFCGGMWTNQTLSEWQVCSYVGAINEGQNTYIYFNYGPDIVSFDFDVYITFEYVEV